MKQKSAPTSIDSAAQVNWTDTTLLFPFLRAAETQTERLEDALQAIGLSRAKMEVLHQLVQAGEPLPLRVLAEGQHCVPSNMTTLIDRLEADGFAERTSSPSDRRSVRAALTTLGEERAAEGMSVLTEIQTAFDAAVPHGDREALRRILVALT